MDIRPFQTTPCARKLLRTLESRFDYHWIAAPDGQLWKLDFPFHLIEFSVSDFIINISMNACRNGSEADVQHCAYLALVCTQGNLLLHWCEGVQNTFENASEAFRDIYPIDSFVTDIHTTLSACSAEIDVQIPDQLRL